MDLSVVKHEIQKGLKLYKAFEYGEQVLSVLEGLDANKKELAASVAKLQAEHAGLAKQVSDATDMLAETDAEAKLVKALAKDEAAGVVAKAKIDAAVIVGKAKDEALAYQEAAFKVEAQIKEATSELKEIEAKSKKANDIIEKQKAALAKL